MTKIIPIRSSDIKKIAQMIEYVSSGISPGFIDDKTFTQFPLNFIHKSLPLNLKFLQECYVAVENNEPLGLISLVPDSHTKTRWKINRLVLGMNAYNIGKQLIDYVVNKYGGDGVETFLTVIDENCPEAIALFKNACSFRNCSKINIWDCDGFRSETTSKNMDFIRKVEPSDNKMLLELDSDALHPTFRSSLIKTEKDFNFDAISKLIDKFKGYKTSKYVFDNPSNKLLEGFLVMQTVDNAHFWIDITIALGYQEYYEDLLCFAVQEIRSQNKDAKIYLGVKDHYQSARFMTDFLSSQKIKICGTFQALIKDYWKPAKCYKEKAASIIVFPEMTSPACNITPFISEF